MNFCPPVVPQSGTGGGKRFRNSALAEYQNRKIFVSLIEKNFGGGQLKNVEKIFLFYSPLGERKRPEGKHSFLRGKLGGIVARRATIKSQCQDFGRNRFGFCPKGTANFQNSDFGRLLPRPRFARARQKQGFYTDF